MAGDAGMFMVHQTVGSVLCCKCGILMAPNASHMCVKCLCSEVDITEGLQKHVIIIHCPECYCYLQPPRTWIKARLESKELLTFCVKRLKNLNKVRLIHAEFIWTEPHSKRIKVRLRVQQEVVNGAVLEQAYMVEYVVQDQMCESCSRVQANPDQWVAAVQLRQHVFHRRTFFCLEQLILKHDAAVKAIRIKQMEHGIDFFFFNRSHAVMFVEFLEKVVPIRSQSDKQLVSQDSKSNTYNYKFTFSVEICPICREDLVCLPPKLSVGNLGPIVICTKVTNSIMLLDPLTLRHCFLDAEQYWRSSFTSLLSFKQLVEYVVLDVEPISSEVNVGGLKYVMADVQHAANTNNMELDKHKDVMIPEVVLVKKSYEELRKKQRKKPRSWKLKSLNMEVDESETRGRGYEERMEKEYQDFLRLIEVTPELWFNISLDGEDEPHVLLSKLLGDLKIREMHM